MRLRSSTAGRSKDFLRRRSSTAVSVGAWCINDWEFCCNLNEAVSNVTPGEVFSGVNRSASVSRLTGLTGAAHRSLSMASGEERDGGRGDRNEDFGSAAIRG